MSVVSCPIGLKYAGAFLAGYLVGRLISTALDAEGDQNIK